MRIALDKVSKRFNQDWLFKDLDYQLTQSNSYAVTGPNGSGKTTLLKIISGMMPCSRGDVSYYNGDKLIEADHIYRYLTIVAPYLQVPEDLILAEFFRFHFNLKPFISGLSIAEIAKRAGLKHALNKPIHTFSSGMKQRVKLALGIFSTTPILLMDEPTTNLDDSGCSWYLEEINRLKENKLLVISSNQTMEYNFCDQIIDLDQFKK